MSNTHNTGPAATGTNATPAGGATPRRASLSRSRPRSGRKLAAIFGAAALGVAAIALYASREDMTGVIPTKTTDVDYGRTGATLSQNIVDAKTKAIKDLAVLFDENLSPNTTKGATIRSQLEKMGQELGRDAAFADFARNTDLQWKIVADADKLKDGRIWTQDDHLQWNWELALKKPMTDLFMRYQTHPQYATIAAKYPEAANWIAGWPKVLGKLEVANARPDSNPDQNRRAYLNNPLTKNLEFLLPESNGQPSRAVRILRSVNEKIRSMGGERILVGMTDEIYEATLRGIGNNDAAGHACEVTRLWDLTSANMERYQRSANNKAAEAFAAVNAEMGITNAQAIVDNVSTQVRAAAGPLQTAKGTRFSCARPTPPPAAARP